MHAELEHRVHAAHVALYHHQFDQRDQAEGRRRPEDRHLRDRRQAARLPEQPQARGEHGQDQGERGPVAPDRHNGEQGQGDAHSRRDERPGEAAHQQQPGRCRHKQPQPVELDRLPGRGALRVEERPQEPRHTPVAKELHP